MSGSPDSRVERIVTTDGVNVDLVPDSCRDWEWDDELWKAAAELIGPVILRAICEGLFTNSTVDAGRFVIGLQALEGDMDITFDADKVIDWWVEGQSGHDGFVRDEESMEQGMVIVRWLESQAARIRKVIGASAKDC